MSTSAIVPQEPLVLNIDQAAAFLGITKQALYSRVRTRAQRRDKHPVPFLRLGYKTLSFRKADLIAWVDLCAKESTGAR